MGVAFGMRSEKITLLVLYVRIVKIRITRSRPARVPWFFRVLCLGLAWPLTLLPAQAEDWTTLSGKNYRDVMVVKVEPDAVTILSDDGGARVPLTDLPAALQTRFNFDPAKAQAAAEIRQKNSELALLVLDELEKLEQAKKTSASTPASDVSRKRMQIIGQMVEKLPEGYIVRVQRSEFATPEVAKVFNLANPLIVPDGTYLLRTPEKLSPDRFVNAYAYPIGKKYNYRRDGEPAQSIDIYDADLSSL